MDAIPAWLSDATTLLWCWQFSNAIGGVRVWVRESQAAQARVILSPRPPPVQWQPLPWICGKCNEHIDGPWQVCWCCGTDKDGVEDPAFHEQAQETGLPGWVRGVQLIAFLTPLFLGLFVLCAQSPMIAVGWIAIMFFGLAQRVSDKDDDGQRDEEAFRDLEQRLGRAPDEESAYDAGDAIALRAWQASVIGFLAFSPLALYSFWLLWKLEATDTLIRPSGRRRVWGAWVASTLALPTLLLWLVFLLVLPAANVAKAFLNLTRITIPKL